MAIANNAKTFVIDPAQFPTFLDTEEFRDSTLSVNILSSNGLSRPPVRFIFLDAQAGDIYQDTSVNDFDPSNPLKSGKSKYVLSVELTNSGPQVRLHVKEFEVSLDVEDGKLKLREPLSYKEIDGSLVEQLSAAINEKLSAYFSRADIEPIFGAHAGAVRHALADLKIYTQHPFDKIDTSTLSQGIASARSFGTIR